MSRKQPYQPNKEQIKFLCWVRKLTEISPKSRQALRWYCNNIIVNGYSDTDRKDLNEMREMFIDRYKKRNE